MKARNVYKNEEEAKQAVNSCIKDLEYLRERMITDEGQEYSYINRSMVNRYRIIINERLTLLEINSFSDNGR